MSENLSKMAMALADVESELTRRRSEMVGQPTEPSDEFADMFDDYDDDESIDEEDDSRDD